MIESLSATNTSFSLEKCSNERKWGSSGSSMMILEVSGRKGLPVPVVGGKPGRINEGPGDEEAEERWVNVGPEYLERMIKMSGLYC